MGLSFCKLIPTAMTLLISDGETDEEQRETLDLCLLEHFMIVLFFSFS